MKRFLIPAVVLATAVLVLVVVNATASTARSTDNTGVTVVEHAVTDAITNPSSATDAAGSILTFNNPVFNAANTKQVGRDQGYCVRIAVGSSWECNWTTFLSGGQITVEGPFLDTGNSTVAITGGTGIYANARGSMDLKYRNPAGTEFDFVFHFSQQ